MRPFINELKDICNTYPFQEKVLIVDTYSMGEQILQTFVKHGLIGINFKIKTVLELAQNVAVIQSETPSSLLKNTVGIHLTYRLLNDLKSEGKLSYFSKLEITPSFSSGIYETIQLLRFAGYSANTIDDSMFLTSKKGADMTRILASYEKMLEVNKFVDEAILYQKALPFTKTEENKIYILQSNLSLSELQKQFLQKLLPENTYKLPLERVYGISVPKREGIGSIHWAGSTPFSYLYEQDNIEESVPNLELFTAKTEEFEVKQIFHQIENKNLAFDQCVLYYTTTEPYVTTLYHLSEKLNIPVTFGEGLSVMVARPGKLVRNLLTWMNNQFSVTIFIKIIHDNLLSFEEDAPSKTRIVGLLRDAKIGWHHERYIPQLQKLLDETKDKLNETDAEERQLYYQKKTEDLQWLIKLCKKIFKDLPSIQGEVNEKQLLKWIHLFISNFAKSMNAIDQAAKEAVVEEIELLIPYAEDALPKYKAFQKIEDLLLTIRIHQSGPKPGSLHVTTYKQGVYNNCKNVFITGLDNRKFPGNEGENPLLLDTERECISNSLPLLRNKSEEKLYTMLQLLAACDGKNVVLSYCHFDVNNNRAVHPAYLLLQAYRLMTNNKEHSC